MLCFASMLPAFAATVTYGFDDELTDVNGNYIYGALSIKVTDADVLLTADSGGRISTSNVKPSGSDVALQCAHFAYYTDNRTRGVGYLSVNEIGQIQPNAAYRVNSGQGIYGGSTLTFDNSKTLYKIQAIHGLLTVLIKPLQM